MSAPAEITTIKVTKALRNRITAAAAEQHLTVQKFMEDVVETYERRRRLAAVAAAMAAADEHTLQQWRDETASWAAVDVDTDDIR